MEVQFAPELEAKLTRSTAQNGRRPDELVQEGTRFVEKVKRGEDAFQAGRASDTRASRRAPSGLLAALMEIRWSLQAAEDSERVCGTLKKDEEDRSIKQASSSRCGSQPERDGWPTRGPHPALN